MKKTGIISSILIILALTLALTGSALATDSAIQPRTAGEPTTTSIEPDLQNESIYGTSLPEKEEQGQITNELQDMNATQKKDNRMSIVVTIVVVTIVLIAALIVWWYRTNY